MNLALVGYGKMGRMIQALAPDYGFQVTLVLDINNNAAGEGFTKANFKDIAAAIEFTAPEAASANLVRLAELGVPTVSGTTGWYAHLDEVKAAFDANHTGFVYSPNFSIGVNVFQRALAETARCLKDIPDYEAWAWEIHHSAKKDAPSGTLLKLVDVMRKTGFDRRIDTSSSRAGSVPGTHEIGFDSTADTITLRHTARSREGFARGALHAARYLAQGHKGCHDFSDILFQ